MRKIIILLVLILATNARADLAKAKLLNSKAYRVPLTVSFPWGICRTSYYSPYAKFPTILRGYACGTRVYCRQSYYNRYRCSF